MAFDFQAAYDELNPADDDHRFYAEYAASRGTRRAIDLGCGTGTLARLLSSRGIEVIGVDPDPEMIRVARSKPPVAGPAGSIEWRLGYSDVLDTATADLALMSGHVAQVFTDEVSWQQTLLDIRRALTERGALAFESRNPGRRKWEAWNRAATLRTVETPDGVVEFWHETVCVELPLVTYDTFTRNLQTGELTENRDVLAFRDEDQLRASVEAAGFVTDIFGDWDRRPTSTDAPELIVIADRS